MEAHFASFFPFSPLSYSFSPLGLVSLGGMSQPTCLNGEEHSLIANEFVSAHSAQ